MKKCPNCNRTYSDESLNFCLDDGTVLISTSDRTTDENIQRKTDHQTEILPQDKVTKAVNTHNNTAKHSFENETVVKSQSVSNESQPQIIKQGVSPMFAYLSVGLLALLVLFAGIGIAFWINFNSNSDAKGEIAQSNSNLNNSEIKKKDLEGKEDLGAIELSDKKTPAPKETNKKETKETPKKDEDNKEANKTPTPTESSTPTPKPTETPKVEKGKYFVILGSFPQSEKLKARKRLQLARNKGLPARIVNTNNVGGLRNGLIAVVLGPFSKAAARKALGRAKSVAPDAYVKAG